MATGGSHLRQQDLVYILADVNSPEQEDSSSYFYSFQDLYRPWDDVTQIQDSLYPFSQSQEHSHRRSPKCGSLIPRHPSKVTVDHHGHRTFYDVKLY